MSRAPVAAGSAGDAGRESGAAGEGGAPPRAGVSTLVGHALLRLVALGVLAFVSSRVFAWAGGAVLAPGPWLGPDVALFRALNGDVPGLTALLFVTLNDPGLDYLALILVLLAYCAWRKPALVPAAALAVGVALALNNSFTQEIHHAGTRPRPATAVAEARTPVMVCGGIGLVTMRGADAAVAPCDAPPPSPGALRGVDWREVWTQFPSFPSGHMREAVALAVLLVAFWRRSWPYVLGVMVLLGFSRVHLGAHYPTDVLGGAAIGLSSGLITVLGLDVLRRGALALHGIPAVERAWSWVARSRTEGHPHLDPSPARALRVLAVLAVIHATLWGLGFAATSPRASHVHSVLQGVDERGFNQITARFDPGVAGPLYWLLGPAGVLYAVLAGAALLLAWRRDRGRDRARFPVALATLLLAVALALQLTMVGGLLFPRLQPFAQAEGGGPIPQEWQALWATGGSFPSRHALLVAALAGVLGLSGRASAAAGHAVALAAAVTAVYFGAAWVSDAVAGYVAGFAAAVGARYAVTHVWPVAADPEPEERPEPEGERRRGEAGPAPATYPMPDVPDPVPAGAAAPAGGSTRPAL